MVSRSEEAAWRTLRANGYKSAIGLCGALNGTLFVVLRVIIYLFSVPFVPPSIIDYGWLFHAPHSIVWAMALAVSGTKSIELVSVVGLLSIIVVVMDLWPLLFNLIPWLYGCINDTPMSFIYDCIISAPYMITIFGISLVLALSTIFILYNIFALLTYIKRAVIDNRPSSSTANYSESKNA